MRYIGLRFRIPPEEAQDFTQSFFAMLLEQHLLERYDETRGAFRPYLRACLDQFVMKQLERARAQKRGGGAAVLPLAENTAEAQDEIPDAIFERAWQREIFVEAGAA